MKKVILYTLCALMTMAVSTGCAVSKKCIEFNLEENAQVVFKGDVNPSFLREGTTEGQEPSASFDVKAQLTDKVLGK